MTKTLDTHALRWSPLILVAAGALVYANSFSGAFVYDDLVHINVNDRIRNLSDFSALLSGRRPVVDVSLALNYAVSGLNVWSYHAFNLCVHLLAGLTLYGIIHRTLEHVRSRAEPRAHYAMKEGALQHDAIGSDRQGTSKRIALAAALIWVVHPLQTQSVTYVIQRGESLMGLFYLLTLYCTVRGAKSSRSSAWYATSIAFCALGMGTKGVMVTAPFMVSLYDWMFLGRGVRHIIRQRWGLYMGLASSLSVLVICGVVGGVFNMSPRPSSAVGFGIMHVSPLSYALSQPGVILHYLQLALWPSSLCLDYAWPAETSLPEAWPAVAIVMLLVSAVIWGVWRKHWLGFVGAWFFLILSPTSSIVPIRDLLVEHRMYLSLVAVVLLTVLSVRGTLDWLMGNDSKRQRTKTGMAVGLLSVVAIGLGFRTAQRNKDYRSELSMWRDVVTKRPMNARGWSNLGSVTDDDDEAFRAYQEAVRADPEFADAHYNLGRLLASLGRYDEAIASYREAIRSDPTLSLAYYNLGNVFDKQGQLDDAIEVYRHAVRIDPGYVRAHYNLGRTFYRTGELGAAILQFQNVLQSKSAAQDVRFIAETHFSLATVWRRQGRLDKAITHFEQALQINPTHDRARIALEACRNQRGPATDR